MNTDAAPASPSPAFLLRRALRFWKTALTLFVVGTTATAGLYVKTAQQYQSGAVVILRENAPQDLVNEDEHRAGARLKDMVFARARLERIVTEMKLYPEIQSLQSRVDELEKRVEFKNQGGPTFAIRFVGATPELAQTVAQRLAETLIEDDRKQRAADSKKTVSFLVEEIDRVRKEVAEREAAVHAFLQANPDASRVVSVDPAASAADLAQISLLEQRLSTLRSVTPAVPGVPVEQGPDPGLLAALGSARAEVESARRALTDQRERLTEAHPDVDAAKRRLDRAESQARSLSMAIEVPRRADRAAAVDPGANATAVASIEDSLANLRSRVGATGRRKSARVMQLEVKLQSLQQDLAETRERYARLETQRFRASMQQNMQTSGDMTPLDILNAAYLPGMPIGNRKRNVLLAGVLMTMLLALGAAFGRAAFDDRLFDRSDVTHLSALPVLGIVRMDRRGHG
jgi:uncharacterized protein involved in exopolysaccharide biosynthesis